MAITKNSTDRQDAEQVLWYAMRVTYRRELKVQQELDERGVDSFVPMHTRHERRGGKIVALREPAIHNLIFVHTTQEWLQAYKLRHPELQYIMTRQREGGHKTIVPDRQMQDFMAVCQAAETGVTFLTAEEFVPKEGQKVRITDGPLAGMEGTFQRVKGGRQRQFVVTIANLISVATAVVSAAQVAPICE